MAQDDLSTVFVTSPPESVVERQARIVEWDPATFENTVDIDGTHVHNMPVRSAVEALTFQAGDVVSLRGWEAADGGPGSWAIDGKLVIPGSGRAEEAIAFMTTALGTAVARAVIAETVHYAFVQDRETTGAPAFTDLDTVGPRVTDVEVATGVMVVIVSAQIELVVSGGGGTSGHMSYELDGPTPRAPNISDSASFLFSTGASDAFDMRPHCAAVNVELGLASGGYDVTAKYQAGADDATFGRRGMLVIAF